MTYRNRQPRFCPLRHPLDTRMSDAFDDRYLFFLRFHSIDNARMQPDHIDVRDLPSVIMNQVHKRVGAVIVHFQHMKHTTIDTADKNASGQDHHLRHLETDDPVPDVQILRKNLTETTTRL